MNNITTTKRNLTSIDAVLMVATLVVGTAGSFLTTTTKTAFAVSNNSGNTVTAQIDRQGARESGFDNIQEQESQNVICTQPGNNTTCTKEGTSTSASTSETPPTPTPRPTCVECFTNLVTQGLLTQDQIDTILKVLNKGSVADLCAALQNGSVSMTDLTNVVDKVVENTTTSAKLLACIGEKGEG